MIGYYDYTVWLTYISLISAGIGIFSALNGTGHPFIGMVFLLISGLCDAFDGRVARMKKNRTEMQCDYGVQIDSLADLVAFGVLPASIGVSMLRSFEITNGYDIRSLAVRGANLGLYTILVFYVLAALIRLAYFNCLEAERKRRGETGANKEYKGVPVTSAAVVFPTVLLIQYFTPKDIFPVYFIFTFLLGLFFILPIRVKKPGTRGILIMVAIGAVDLLILLLLKLVFKI